MKKLLSLLIAGLFLTSAYAEDGHEMHNSKHHDKSEETKRHSVKSLTLNNGKKWGVDPIMKENMDAINIQFIKLNNLVNAKKVTPDDYSKLSIIIADSAEKIANNCNMEQKKDETFHVVLGDLLIVSEDLKNAKKVKHATEKLKHALKVYTEYFDQSFSK